MTSKIIILRCVETSLIDVSNQTQIVNTWLEQMDAQACTVLTLLEHYINGTNGASLVQQVER